MALVLFLTANPLAITAQCPGTTYSVGTGVGIPDLSSAPAGVATLTAGQSIRITGTFTVDAGTWSIIGANVYFASSASEVVVNPGTTLDASLGSVFERCNTTFLRWSRIRVQTGGTMLADNCVFNNSVNAIYIAGTATFHITNNIFNTCTNGLQIAGMQNPANHSVAFNDFINSKDAGVLFTGNNVELDYNTYTNNPTPFSTGVRVSSGQNLLIADGSMINLKRGLEIMPNPGSRCIEMKEVVFSGLTGVFTEQAQYGLHIHDCTIRATKTAIDIKNHLTAQTPPAGVCNGNIQIERNVINSFEESCVRITSVKGDGTVTVLGNTIATEIGSGPGFQYYGIEIQFAYNANIVVEVNHIVNQGSFIPGTNPGGIYLRNCKKSNSVSFNTIQAGLFGGVGDLQFGIHAVGSPHFTARNNNVDGGPNIMDRAISIETPMEDIDLCCNNMTRSTKGLYFLGAHEDCIVQTSIFGAHSEALYYDMVVSTSAPQIHRGNDWSGAATTWDGYYNGSPLLAPNVEYQVAPTLLPNLLSQIFVTGGSPSDWFSTPSSTELNCSSICGNGFSGDGEEELTGNDDWAMNPLSDAAYEVLHWESKRHLYAKLLGKPSLLQDAQAAAFFEDAQNGNLGKFYAIEVGIATLYDPNVTSDPIQKLADLRELNASIVAETDYQAFEKDINAIYLNALTEDDWDFSDLEKTIIDDIAALCPQAAGNAVYTSRFLQENYRIPTWNMECAFVGERSSTSAKMTADLSVYPNPAGTIVNIAFAQPVTTGCTIELLSLTGQVLRNQTVGTGSSSLSLPVHQLPNGYYFLRVSMDGHPSAFQKLSIVH